MLWTLSTSLKLYQATPPGAANLIVWVGFIGNLCAWLLHERIHAMLAPISNNQSTELQLHSVMDWVYVWANAWNFTRLISSISAHVRQLRRAFTTFHELFEQHWPTSIDRLFKSKESSMIIRMHRHKPGSPWSCPWSMLLWIFTTLAALRLPRQHQAATQASSRACWSHFSPHLDWDAYLSWWRTSPTHL